MSDVGQGQISAPDVKVEDGKIVATRKAIADGKQARSVYNKLVEDQSKRNQVNADIWEHYTGKDPHNPFELAAMGQDWRYNFPTLFLQGIIDRVIPNFINAIDSAQSLTQATLPDQIDGQPIVDRDQKVQRFRKRFTTYVRTKWEDYRDFNSNLAQELVLIGYAFAVNTDEDTPWPQFVTQAGGFVHERAGQLSNHWQVFALREDILMHQLIDQIEDVKIAEAAGWDIDECIKSINTSMPLDPGRDLHTNPRTFAEIIRDCTSGMSFISGAKGVSMGHLFITEPIKEEGKGRITHFINDRVNGFTLLERERRFDSMSDVVAPITLEPGGGHFYGSKGLGRVLVNLSIAVDELVNDACSQVKMAGMMVMKTDSKSAMQTQIKVRMPFVVIASDGGQLQKETFQLDSEAFLAVYGQLQKLAEIAAGAYIANTLSTTQESSAQGDRRTAREATIDYTRELQSKSASIARFGSQYAKGVLQRVQVRLTKKGNPHADAKQFQKELQEQDKLSPQEIELLGKSPVLEIVIDLTDVDKQKKAQVAASLQGNQMVDQKKALFAMISNGTDPQFAAELIIPDAIDPTIAAEQTREQVLEMYAIKGGAPGMPVSPRDEDKVHLAFLTPNIQKLIVEVMSTDPLSLDPEKLDYLNALTVHGEAHVAQMEQKKQDPKIIKQAQAQYAAFSKVHDAVVMGKKKALAKASVVLAQQHKIQSDQAQAEAQGQGQPQGDPNNPPAQPAGQENEMTEKTLVAWIGMYDKLPDDCKRNLEGIGGIGPSQSGHVTPTPKPGEPVDDPVSAPQLPSPSPDMATPPAPAPAGPGPGEPPPPPEPVGPGPGPMPPMPEGGP